MIMRSVNIKRRILVINPNSNPAVSEGIRLAGATVTMADTELVVVNPSRGPLSIESPEQREQAIAPLLDLAQRYRGDDFDAYVLACYDDIALTDLRHLLGKPVVGAFEASIAAARSVTSRFCIVTTVDSALPTINGLLREYGAQDSGQVMAAGIGVAEAAGGGASAEIKLIKTIAAAIEQGAEAIVLGSGGLIGRAPALANVFNTPVIDSVLSAITIAEGLARLRIRD
ncbi:Asp/Glu racemase [Pseudomonas sp. Ag1]|uniref:aspartate/glutamate racemase family protein n=1 Tax=Pseudomonas sp. Ag1 TaxID=1197727 RepID=UPI000272C8AF|nr:aspartate/glutamate racemase family protein [Pseudomonas sp. Ag1]EJF69765.1 Asp/Glu racemase [Pseudomonas sp. Ag1]